MHESYLMTGLNMTSLHFNVQGGIFTNMHFGQIFLLIFGFGTAGVGERRDRRLGGGGGGGGGGENGGVAKA